CREPTWVFVVFWADSGEWVTNCGEWARLVSGVAMGVSKLIYGEGGVTGSVGCCILGVKLRNGGMRSYESSENAYGDTVDYLSKGKDELIDLKKRKTEAQNAPKSTKRQTLQDMVGSSNGIRKKKMYEVDNSETIIEHVEFMDDLIRKLKDRGDGITDPFKILKSKVEKYLIHDVDSHRRMRKPKVGKKFIDVDQLKELEKLKDLKKGKQSKQKRYPSIGEVEGARFLDLLGDVFDMTTCNGLTLMSNQHKGLIEAVKEHAEHRQCARHIYKVF
nr:pentatricopeptide repeat-containing protein [Tanacetum cinerariifolium]